MFWRWQEGRQGSGYEKLKLFSFFFFDLYLLRFPEKSCISTHLDPVPRWKHFRFNVVVKQAEGGEFVCPNAYINWSRIKFFRPDIHEHSVTEITKGTRYVLSLGWLWFGGENERYTGRTGKRAGKEHSEQEDQAQPGMDSGGDGQRPASPNAQPKEG